ncbi:zinc-ribbon domain-containing protein, partial [Candidatus Marinimicrobia bacterium]|nr:zinc-ribbon domain-containing protein [Candidatus Neomarinimicrobiota bacterium]
MKLSKEYNLAVLYPNIAKEWHSTKNGGLTPFDVTPGSGKKVWWICKKGHE